MKNLLVLIVCIGVIVFQTKKERPAARVPASAAPTVGAAAPAGFQIPIEIQKWLQSFKKTRSEN